MKILATTYRPYLYRRALGVLQARSTGHYVVEAPWRDKELRKEFVELYWCVRGCGEFRHGEESWRLRGGEVCCYFPGDTHRITAASEEWEYYFLTFDGAHQQLLCEAFELRREPVAAGLCPEALFVQLAAHLRQLDVAGEAAAGAIAYEILSRAALRIPETEPVVIREFRTLVEERYDDPALEVGAISRELKIHRATLTRLVREHCGVPPAEYLLSYRIQLALSMLSDTGDSVKEIAEAAGFDNANYFAKVIRRRFGKSPSQFRVSASAAGFPVTLEE